MRKRLVVLLAVALVSAHLTSAAPAHAEPSAQERAQAANLFDQGLAAFKQKRCVDAIPLFEGSAQISPSVGAQLYLGDCHQQLGRLASAYGAFREAARMASKLSDKREKVALDQASQIEKQLAYLVVDASPASRVEGLEIRLDGKPLPAAVWGTNIPVDAGVHKLDLSAPGHEPASLSVDIQPQAGRTTERIPTLQKQKAAAPSPAPVPAPPVTQASPERTVDPQGRTLLVLQLLSDVPRDGTEIRLDGSLRAPDEWTKLTELPPGSHRVDVTFRCREALPLSVELAKGYLHTLVVSLPSAKRPVPPGCGDPPPPSPGGSSTQRTVGFVVAGVGGAAAIAGGVVAFRAASKATEAYDRADDAAGDAQKPTYTTGLVLAGIGGAALITGGVLVLTSGPAKATARAWQLAPVVGRREGAVLLSARF